MYTHGFILRISTRSEMDIIPVFGTVVGGSNPSGCTKKEKTLIVSVFSLQLAGSVFWM